MAYTKTEWKDRIVEYPNRYTDQNGITYTLTPAPGIITEEGTLVTATNLNKLEEGVLKAGVPLSSYMAFCSNVNADSLDAGFGKNNEEQILGLGLQLAMYSWFKGDSKITYPFTNLIKCNTFSEICADFKAFADLLDNPNLVSLVTTSPFALGKYNSSPVLESAYAYNLCKYTGLDAEAYPTLTSLFNSQTALLSLWGNQKAITTMANDFIVGKALTSTWVRTVSTSTASGTTATSPVQCAKAINLRTEQNDIKTTQTSKVATVTLLGDASATIPFISNGGWVRNVHALSNLTLNTYSSSAGNLTASSQYLLVQQ